MYKLLQLIISLGEMNNEYRLKCVLWDDCVCVCGGGGGGAAQFCPGMRSRAVYLPEDGYFLGARW